MIFTDRIITIRKGESKINEPIIVYRGDYEVEVRFAITNSKFKFMDDTNLIETENTAYGQLAILTPYGGNIFSEVAECNEGTVTFVLTKAMLDQIEEVGLYSFQIRLFDYNKESRVSIPPVEFGIEVREPITSEDHDNSVNNAIVGYSIAKIADAMNEKVPDTFNGKGDYNKTIWETGDRITEGKLNKIEDAIDTINQNEKNDIAALDKRITSNFNVLDSTKVDAAYVDTKVNAVASGAPKGVYATLAELQYAKPNGDSNVYIVSEDGCWYYWKGSSWSKGGVYQGVKLEEHSVKFNHVDGVKQLNKCTPETIVMGAYIDINYDEIQSENNAYAKIPIIPDHTYVICRYGQENQENSMTNSVPFSITSIDGANLVTARENSIYSGVDNNNVRYGIFTAPANSAYLNFNVRINAVSSIDSTYCYDVDEIEGDFHDLKNINAISQMFDVKLKDEDIRNEFEEFINSIQVISRDIYTDNAVIERDRYVNTDGDILSAKGWAYARVKVRPSTVYSLYLPSQTYTSQRGYMRFEDQLTNFISYLKWESMLMMVVDGYTTVQFQTPENCHYICFNTTIGESQNYAYDDSHDTMLVEETMNTDDFIPFIERIGDKKIFNPTNFKDYVKPLLGVKWVVVGDSLTEKNIRATKNYHDYVSEDTGVTVVNMGVSGTGYMRRQDEDKAFYQRILNIPTDTDIVTIFGSGNDLSLPLGAPSDTGTDTICGCMHQTIQNLFSVLPGVRVGIVLPCPWGSVPPSNKGNKMELYCEALKEIAGEYSIPVLDLYYGSNLRPWDPTFRDLYYKRDDGSSVHPDEDGHKILANKFKMFIQSL